MFTISTELIDGKAVLLLEDLVDGKLVVLVLFCFLLYVNGNGYLDKNFFLDVDRDLFYYGL